VTSETASQSLTDLTPGELQDVLQPSTFVSWRLRVLHIGKYFPPFAGGIEYFLNDLMLAQQEQGLSVAAVVHHHASRHTQYESYRGLPIWRVGTLGRLLYAPISPDFPRVLRSVVNKFRPDVLHLHLPNPSAFWALTLSRLRDIPWIVHWHSDVTTNRVGRAVRTAYHLYRPLEQRTLARADTVITTSPDYLASSAALANWRYKCEAVPLGLDPARLVKPAQEILDWAENLWPQRGLRVLAIGRLTYYKGHDVLLRAVERTPGVQLCIVGSGDLQSHLGQMMIELDLRERVRLVGSLPDEHVQALLATCDCLCLPSIDRTEAFGIVMLEAMSHAKPIVASEIPGAGVGWVARQGGALLVPPEDTHALSEALATYGDDARLRQTHGAAGAKAFEEHFQIAQVTGRLTAIYDRHYMTRQTG